MSDGKRRPGRPGRSEAPPSAPEEDEDATRDIPFLTRPEETRLGPVEPVYEETRLGPVEPLTEETRLGPVASFPQEDDLPPLEPPALETRLAPTPDARSARVGRSRGAARSARPEPPPPPAEVHTDVMPPKPPRPRGGPEGKATGGLVGAPERRASPPKASASPASVGVVRLSPLEPLGAKVVAEEEAPALRTMFANHSALLAEQLRDALSAKMYGRGPHRVLRIDEPEGPSTAGGKLARQAISLVPRKGTGTSLTCGWVDVSKREAQLRNFEAVAKRYEMHHGEPLEMQAEEYERFLNDVEAVLAQAVIKVRVIVPEEAGAVRVARPSASAKGVPPVWVGLLAVLAFVLGLLAGRMGSGG